ncbi:hypothetical protein MMC30_007482 [Trapelia coarctata]|nr:hypothetical protein [Trapelia coarctata]
MAGEHNLAFLMNLRKESELLRELHREFILNFDDSTSKVISYYETKVSPSAIKFSFDDEVYQRVRVRLREFVGDSVRVVQLRFANNAGLSYEQYQCLRNLNRPLYSEVRDTRIHEPEQGTLQEFFESSTFQSWCDNDHSTKLWVRGATGQGKSVLAKAAINHLEQLSNSTSVVGNIKVLYFFFYSQEKEFSTPQALIRALIVQLLTTPQMFDYLPRVYQTRPEDFMTERFETLCDIFSQLLRDPYYKRIYCVIDALDECENPTLNLLPAIKRLFCKPAENSGRLRLIITSRPVLDLARELESFPYIDLKATTEDLQLFINRRISSLERGFTPALRSKAAELLLERAERTFLWASIVIKRLERMLFPSLAKVRVAVKDSSTDLDELYCDIILQILQGPLEGQKLLTWVAYGRRALTLKELEAALATQIDSKSKESTEDYQASVTEQAVASAAGIILEITAGTVHLIHQSAKDFILKRHPLDKADFLADLSPDIYLAKICLTYLNFDDFHSGPCGSRQLLAERNRIYSLLDYASRKWHTHIASPDEVAEVLQLLRQLVEPRSLKLLSWGEAAGLEGLGTANNTFDIANKAGIVWLAGVNLNNEIITSEHVTAAVKNLGKGYELLETLLRQGTAVITEEAKEEIARAGNEQMVRLLLDNHADTKNSKRMMVAAAANRKSGREVMKLLLNTCGCMEIAVDFIVAASKNPESGNEILGLVLSSGNCKITEDATVAVFQHSSYAVIQYMIFEMDGLELTQAVVATIASRSGHHHERNAIMEQVLRKDTVKITESAMTDIFKAFEPTTIELLLTRADVRLSDSAVIGCARWCNIGLFQALLDRRPGIRVTEALIEAAALNISDLDAKEILMLLKSRSEMQITEPVIKAAANRRTSEIVELLLNIEDIQITGAVLEVAASNNKCGLKLMEFLLNRSNVQVTEAVTKAAAKHERNGFEIMCLLSTRNDFLVTTAILEAAAKHDRGDDMMFLLLKGNDIQISEKVVKAAYSNPIRRWYTMELLLHKGGKTLFERLRELINMPLGLTKQVFGQLLIAAAFQGHRAVAQMLLENEADVRAKEKESEKTALHYAALHYNEEILNLLLKHGADVHAKDKDQRTALHYVPRYFHYSLQGIRVIELFVEKGADLNAEDKNGMTALHCAAEFGEGYWQLGIELTNHGADILAKDNRQRTALHYAAESGVLTGLQNLWDMAILHAKDIDQKTALNLAASNGHPEVVHCVAQMEIQWVTQKKWLELPTGAGEHDKMLLIMENMEAGPLHLAAYSGDEVRIRLLLENGAKLNTMYDSGTPLHWAACGGHEEIVRLLLEMGLDINSRNVLGTPLLWAAQSGHEKAVRYLLEQGAKVDVTDFRGKTASYLAAKNSHANVARLLLEYGG